jgi:hypothetical protein
LYGYEELFFVYQPVTGIIDIIDRINSCQIALLAMELSLNPDFAFKKP